jgi:predicted signal transduction protein with EAL and GGDEF domain
MPGLLSLLKWVGTLAGALGALLMALNVPQSGWAFAFFLVSSSAWTMAGVFMRDAPLWILNGIFIAIDILGVVRWIL